MLIQFPLQLCKAGLQGRALRTRARSPQRYTAAAADLMQPDISACTLPSPAGSLSIQQPHGRSIEEICEFMSLSASLLSQRLTSQSQSGPAGPSMAHPHLLLSSWPGLVHSADVACWSGVSASLKYIEEHTWLGMDRAVGQGFTCGSELSSVTLARKDLMSTEFCRLRGISYACCGISYACCVTAGDDTVQPTMTRPDRDLRIADADLYAALTSW